MGDLGLFGPFVAEEYGGSNVGYVSYIIAVEEIARIDGSQAATLGGRELPWDLAHSITWKRRAEANWLPDLCSGNSLSSSDSPSPTRVPMPGLPNHCDARKGSGSSTVQRSSLPIRHRDQQGLCGPGDNCKRRGRKERAFLFPCAEWDARVRDEDHARKDGMAGPPIPENSTSRTAVYPREPSGPAGDGFHRMLATLDGGRLSIAAMGLGGRPGCI